MKKSQSKSLGLELSALHLKPGEIRTARELAAWMTAADEPISYQRIQQIEQRALRKIRVALYRDKELEKEFKDHGWSPHRLQI